MRLTTARLMCQQSLKLQTDNLYWSSNRVRQTFIDVMTKKHDHRLVKSSPVVPHCDPTLAFVNSGMNQFKNIFLGVSTPVSPRVCNSQKCIRVGGKHNDLTQVGTDGTHHTFFEMLGNWSFGSYFKAEACAMSLELLVDVFGLDRDRLYFTYFGGDDLLNIPPDDETREIWRQLGVPESHVLPFSGADNMWEMGPSGPCGPCTEIHYDHVTGRRDAGERVNRGHADLTELWNIVFIQYNRKADGVLHKLDNQHVDTGMGFERLVSILQNKQSNYDTDLFQRAITGIQKYTGCPEYAGRFDGASENTDTAYRILADHARMVTVALADGMFPDEEHKLRNIMRKCFLLSENLFKSNKGLLCEVTNYVCESLHEAYPEIAKNLHKVQHIINHEEELFKVLRLEGSKEWEKLLKKNEKLDKLRDLVGTPGLIQAYKYLTDLCNNQQLVSLDNNMLYKLTDTFGLDEDVITCLASALGLKTNMDNYESFLAHEKRRKRNELYTNQDGGELNLADYAFVPTVDSYKYDYTRSIDGKYKFDKVDSQIVGFVVDNRLVAEVNSDQKTNFGDVGLILDRTNMYSEAGGQTSDTGLITIENKFKFKVNSVVNNRGVLIHWGAFYGENIGPVKVHDLATVAVDEDARLDTMRNHTATHLLNMSLRQILTVTSQRSSHVHSDCLLFDFNVYREQFALPEIKTVEETINSVIKLDMCVNKRILDSTRLSQLDDVTMVPGEVYPDTNIQIIEVCTYNLLSREACCGTHVLRTSDVIDFVITSVKSIGSGARRVRAVTGDKARVARSNLIQLQGVVSDLENIFSSNNYQVRELSQKVDRVRKLVNTTEDLPYVDKQQLQDRISVMFDKLRHLKNYQLGDSLVEELSRVLKENKTPYLIHNFVASDATNFNGIQFMKLTKNCPQVPVIFFCSFNGFVKARCFVPQDKVSENLTAEKWLKHALQSVDCVGNSITHQDPNLTYNMKQKKLSPAQFDVLVNEAKKFIERVENLD